MKSTLLAALFVTTSLMAGDLNWHQHTSKYEALLTYYTEGTLPTPEQLEGVFSGRHFEIVSPNFARGSALVCVTSDDGPIFEDGPVGCDIMSNHNIPDFFDHQSATLLAESHYATAVQKSVNETTGCNEEACYSIYDGHIIWKGIGSNFGRAGYFFKRLPQ